MSINKPLKPVSEIGTEELLEITTFYHQFYDDLEDEVTGAIKGIQIFLKNDKEKPYHEDLLDKDIKKIYPFWHDTQHEFYESAQYINKAISVIPQVVIDIRKELYPMEQIDSLINVPKSPEPQMPNEPRFLGMKNPFGKKPTHDPNSPYRLSNKRTKFLERIEEKWILINEYQTKGESTWSEYILDVSSQKDYRDLYLDVFNYFIVPTLSSVFHYGLWLNLANEKNLSRDIMMVGMQQTLRKDEQEFQKPGIPQTPSI